MDARGEAHIRIESWLGDALAAVEPAAAIRRNLQRNGDALTVGRWHAPMTGRVVVLSVGKAAVAMARGADEALGGRVDAGLIVTKDGHADVSRIGSMPVLEAAHPVPDARSVEAGQAALSLVAGLGAGDLLLALISGGGSSLLEAPRPPVTLPDLATATDRLLRAGAPIHDLNALRTPLSLIKGGGLRLAAGPATVITLVLSDVLGNDPRVIASGPTVPGDADATAGLGVLRRYGVLDRVPGTIIRALEAETRDSGGATALISQDVVVVVGDNAAAVAAADAAVRRDGLRSRVIWSERRGEASLLAREWVAACEAAAPEVDVLLGGGEATVTVAGDGVGGRNTEFALAAALALAERGERAWVVASLATDGQDGPTDVAGAVADATTVERARAAGVSAADALVRNDSLRVFEAAGGLVRPGPTGTNVNDLYVAVRVPLASR
ncbi:MAG: D-glycerate 2-kinase [uncultured Thermomicrobiales bacterium]|uniref:D-glycerate 2-kinase n=1 Tax=uncultured Thermomicrobiales bacterium TaxID=1645740 RepID=A0A6J4U809_9BACT|nr:MAG: D-glycerate 2-kinase [uncultured Thermomicrobiales bacterium]